MYTCFKSLLNVLYNDISYKFVEIITVETASNVKTAVLLPCEKNGCYEKKQNLSKRLQRVETGK